MPKINNTCRGYRKFYYKKCDCGNMVGFGYNRKEESCRNCGLVLNRSDEE